MRYLPVDEHITGTIYRRGESRNRTRGCRSAEISARREFNEQFHGFRLALLLTLLTSASTSIYPC
jgi:hypothetical protein